MEREQRPSAYLVERCQGLGRVFDFFLAPHNGGVPALDERLVIFLVQLDFWDWELDNLIHAFTTFAGRSRAWENASGHALAQGLQARGLPVRFAAVKDLRDKRQARAGRRQVVAPVAELNRVIAAWNGLLSACEARVMTPAAERRRDAELGAQVLADLSGFRKSAVEEEA